MHARILRQADVIDNDELNVVTLERLERRLTEESGAVREDIHGVRADVKDLRAEMIDRQASMLRWLLGFFVAQTAALAAMLAALR